MDQTMRRLFIAAIIVVTIGTLQGSLAIAAERTEVVFWHFWGGRDRPIVEQIVKGFNESQDHYEVRPIAMAGSNLDVKFLLSVAGGDPPDLLNHDDPVVGDWAHHGILTPLDKLAPPDEIQRLNKWLFPAARELGAVNGRLFALCNGLDIRALYCNRTLLDEHGLQLPATLEDLDDIAETISPAADSLGRNQMGYLPDPRRLWAWGIVFGGQFSDPAGTITADDPKIISALSWMADFSRRYGSSEVAAFRSGEQALTGAAFPLLANRRYAVVMDGQWRIRDVAEAADAAERNGTQADEIAVVPLPPPPGGVANAGWVNGNFFVVPQGARQKPGAWEFMKYWMGFSGNEVGAAEACAAGGWIPASQEIVDQAPYQKELQEQPLLREFVSLAASPYQRPVPNLPVSSFYYQEVVRAAQQVMYRGADPQKELQAAAERVRQRLREVVDE
ncbi:extracellular solute-binding protein [Bythopirellula polymerisocia]|uniref:Bacterial extracellular solute-binding protein n=1 Tax=Bythopirellula polymerisocia TaxID=2528003 RepID=A0A5C6CPZ5_9BACT|nr:extracellular solute-binding protein [Bythopirellula polymerisocia]TWU26115.1 Bacterial extracellular solute-binding protein [Bythopirellula polymerisocia]